MALAAWIERSLERLEWLEAERERLDAIGPSATAKLAECDTEIATLYDVLHGAADDGEEEEAPAADAAAPSPVADEYTLTFIEHVGWTTFRDLDPLPLAVAIAAPAIVAPMIVAAAPIAAPANDVAPAHDVVDYIVDEPWRGGGLGWRFIVPAAAALLMFVAIGTWLALQPSEAVASTPIEPATTVDAAAIPDDTQEPEVAKGIDADRTPPSQAAAALDAEPTPAARPKRVQQAPRRERTPRGHAIDLGKSREPLAGLQ